MYFINYVFTMGLHGLACCMAVVGRGWLWLAVVGCGWLWMAVVGCGWLWMAAVGCGWLSLATATVRQLHTHTPQL